MAKRGHKKVLTLETLTIKPEEKRENPFTKNLGGRPRKYETEAELVTTALEYFEMCDKHYRLPNKAGLLLWLGLFSRATYAEYRERFPNAIGAIDGYIEEQWVSRLNGAHATGPIFYLKNAFHEDYKDKHETDITSGGEKIATGAEATALATKFDEFFKSQQA